MRRWIRLFPVALVGLALAYPSPLRAAPYDVTILIDDEADIEQLYYDGEIDEEARDRLMTLFLSKVDLNLATRDELYELPDFTYAMADAVIAMREKRPFLRAEELAGVEGVSPEVYDQCLPFVFVRGDPTTKKWDAELRTGAVGRTEHRWPSFFLRGKTSFLGHAGAGFLIDVRPMIGHVKDAAPGSFLSAAPAGLRFGPDAFYAFWNGPRLAAILGSYRVGYGLRVTLDTTRRQLPHGWMGSQDFYEDNESGRIRPLDGFLGAAVRLKQIDLGRGWFDVSVFGSASPRDLYYSEVNYEKDGKMIATIVDQATVDDPAPRSLYCDYPTLQNILLEILGGGNATYFINQRSSVGFTGYGAHIKFLTDAEKIRPANSSIYPEDRSTFGAYGLNAKFGWGRYDFGLEATLTDKAKPGILAMAWVEPRRNLTIIPSFRYYHPDFDNPYARGLASADEFLGLRARDELGGRLQTKWRALDWLRLYADIDLWWRKYPGQTCDPEDQDPDSPTYCQGTIDTTTVEPAVDLSLIFRSVFSVTSKERLSLWLNYRDRDLSKSGHGLSYEGKGDKAGGAKVSWAFQASTSRIPRMLVQAMFKQYFEDTSRPTSTFDHSWYVWLRISAKLNPGPLLVARVKYFDDFTTDDPDMTRGESYVDAYLQATQRIPWRRLEGSLARFRVGWQRWVDHRTKWEKVNSCLDKIPTRNEFLVKGYLLFKF